MEGEQGASTGPPGGEKPPAEPPPPAAGTRVGDTWDCGPAKPLQQRANVAMILVAATIAAAIASLFADLHQLDLINRAIDGERVGLAELTDSDDAVGQTATIYLIALALAAITFLLWYSRAYRNLPGLGRRDPSYGPRWAIAYWFIPIVTLFRPKQVMNEIWRGSDPDHDGAARGWKELPVSALLHWWWAAWLISNFASQVPFGGSGITANELKNQATGYVVADVLAVIAGILAILVIRATTARQEERRRRVELGTAESMGAAAPAPAAAAG